MVDFSLEAEAENDQHEEKIYDEHKLSTDYIPEEMPHRQELMSTLMQEVFRPVAQGKRAKSDVFVYGKPGTGKTMAVKATLQKIKEKNSEDILYNFQVIYVNCSAKSSESAVLEKIAEEVGEEWTNGISMSKNKEKVLESIRDIDRELVVILDELDELKKKSGDDYINDIIYTLTRPHECLSMTAAEYGKNFNLISLSNDPKITDYLEDWNKSKMDYTSKSTDAYTPEEITDILQARQKEAFDEEFLDRQALQKISEETFNVFDSDVRKALGILKRVPEKISSGVSYDNIQEEEVVRAAISSFKKNYIQEMLQNRDEHFLVLMNSFCTNLEEDKHKTKYILEGYHGACELLNLEKRSRSYVQRSLSELEDKNLVRTERDYNDRGNPKKYYSNLNISMLKKPVEQKMDRNPQLRRIRNDEEEEGLTEEEKKAQEESEEVMDKLI